MAASRQARGQTPTSVADPITLAQVLAGGGPVAAMLGAVIAITYLERQRARHEQARAEADARVDKTLAERTEKAEKSAEASSEKLDRITAELHAERVSYARLAAENQLLRSEADRLREESERLRQEVYVLREQLHPRKHDG